MYVSICILLRQRLERGLGWKENGSDSKPGKKPRGEENGLDSKPRKGPRRKENGSDLKPGKQQKGNCNKKLKGR